MTYKLGSTDSNNCLFQELVSNEGLPEYSLRQGNCWSNQKPQFSAMPGTQEPKQENKRKGKQQPENKKKQKGQDSSNPAHNLCFQWNSSGSCNCNGRYQHLCSALVGPTTCCRSSDHGAHQHTY